MKDTENKEGLLSEGIAKAKRVVRRATQTTDSSEKKKETAEEKKTTRGRKPAAKKTTTKAVAGKTTAKTTKATEKETETTEKKATRRVSTRKAPAKKKESISLEESLKIIPLGGLEQIGMNITAFEYGDNIVVVDCGLSFPEDDMLGVDLVIPDVTYLKDNIDKVKGFVITHGHEDHIGAIPYVLKEVNAPIYATKLTMGLIENKLKEHTMPKPVKHKVVKYGQSINLGCFRVEFIRTNHSISDAAALAIFTPAGLVVHTGDFKVDFTPVNGETIDLQRFGELGKKGVLALMGDSTNIMKPGFTMSERTVGKTFDNIFAENEKHRIIVATFASNVDRVQQIINSAEKYGRKVVVEGRSMVNVMTTATELGYLDVPKNILIEMEQMKNYPPEKLVLITTGSQGEAMAGVVKNGSEYSS